MSQDGGSNFLFNQLVAGKIGRREFVGRMMAAGATAGLVNTMLVSGAKAATPKKGGRITVGGEAAQAKDSMDPTKFYSTSNLMMGYTVYDTLVNRGADLKPTPWLAESFEAGKDASDWVFKLRKGVTFHNGAEMTADDVIYSCWRHAGKTSESPAKAYMGQIADMKKEDKHTVRFTLSAPNADFPIVLSDTRVHVTQDGVEDFTGTPPGTGPFKVKEFKPGSRYVFERNDNYWSDDGPWVDEVEVVGIGDLTARVNALISGDINVLLELDPKAAGLIKKNKATQLLQTKSGKFVNTALMLDRAPTDNNDVRLALKYALDREQTVKNVFKGFGTVGNDHPISPVDPFYCGDIPQRVYDPDKARFHIKKAGMENTAIDYYASDVPGAGSLAAAQVYQQSAAACGVKLNIIQPPADTYWSAVWIQKPMSASGWDPRPVPDLIFSIAFKGGADYNETAWNKERFDKLLVEARSVTDFNKRKEMYCEMQRMLQDDGGHITTAFTDLIDAARTEVKGITPHPSAALGFYQFARTVWIDS